MEGAMATVTTERYRAYTPRPFTRQERDTVTILFGGLHWRAERILQAVLEGAGYHARVLPVATRDDLLTGREVADIGQCCPTSFTTGNLANFLKGEAGRIGVEAVNKNYVYLTAGACGACRFGQYHQSYELALRNSGLGAFRMFLMAQDQLDQTAAPWSRRASSTSSACFATGRGARPIARWPGTSRRVTSRARCAGSTTSSPRSRSTGCA
jgi:hypothetical protein